MVTPCAGLALYKGLVYAAFGSHCDRPQYWPWIFAFEAKSLKISTFWTSPSFICKTLCPLPLRYSISGLWQGDDRISTHQALLAHLPSYSAKLHCYAGKCGVVLA